MKSTQFLTISHSERRPKSTARGTSHAFLEAIELLGHSANNQARLYGEVLDLVSAPVSVSETLVFVDVLNRKSGASAFQRPSCRWQEQNISQRRRTTQPDYR